MDTENYYDTISENSFISISSAEKDAQKQHIYIQVSIPDINMKVSLSTLHLNQWQSLTLRSGWAQWVWGTEVIIIIIVIINCSHDCANAGFTGLHCGVNADALPATVPQLLPWH